MRNTALIGRGHRNRNVTWVILNWYYQDPFHHTINTLEDSMAILVCSALLYVIILLCYSSQNMKSSEHETKFHPLLRWGDVRRQGFFPNEVCVWGEAERRHTRGWKWERSRSVWGLDSKCLRTWPVMRKERWLKTWAAIPRGGWTLSYCWRLGGVVFSIKWCEGRTA